MKYKKYTDQKGPLRLMIYDRTCRGKGPLPGLTHGWIAGALVYSALGRIDAWHGVASWTEAFDWLLTYAPDQQISEIQFWGHGEWGGLWIEDELIKIDALEPGHALFEQMNALRTRLIGNGNALWWFRCCDTFGTALGQDFARKWTDFFACRAAGHTYTINVLQSGLHVLENGAVPHWPESEGVVAGLSHARNSHLLAPNTITCFHGEVPKSSNRKRSDDPSPLRKPYVPALGFHQLTALYDPIVRHWSVTSRIRVAVLEALDLAPGMRILELGAGPGRLAVEIKHKYPDVSVVVVDIDPSMVARTRKNAAKANVEITSEQVDMTCLRNLGKFDRIFSTMTFHHLPPQAKQQALLASRTCLQLEGRFVVVDFSKPRGAIQWALFSFIQQPLDGFHNTSPHRDGRYEEVVRSSFAEVRSEKVWRTIAGTIEMFVCSG